MAKQVLKEVTNTIFFVLLLFFLKKVKLYKIHKIK
jgi:hypothetical protein